MDEKESKTGKKSIGTMNIVLIFIALVLLVFVAVMIWLYYHTGGIPDTLVTCVFAACGGECGVMGWIKTTKDRYRERDYELEDREHNEKLMEQQSAAESEDY